MNRPGFSVQKLAAFLIVIFLLIHFLKAGQEIIAPIVFSIFFALMLKPICNKVETFLPNSALAIGLTFLIVLLPLVVILFLFSYQLFDVFDNMDSISEKLQDGFNDLYKKIRKGLDISKKDGKKMLKDSTPQIIQAPLGYLKNAVNNSTTFLINFLLVSIYVYFILLYRKSIKKFYLMQFGHRLKGNAERVISRIQTVVKDYLYGLGLVVIILGVLNTIGLYLIGIDYPMLWGFLAALLAIIPYIGTILGGLLPFLYALATTGTFWQPAAVLILFVTVQTIEGNIITPKVVGSSIKLNPLASIIALILGGSLWGISGLILSLPLMAIFRVVCVEIDELKPFGLLLSDRLVEQEELFEEKYDEEKFRIINFFRRNRKE